MFRGRPRKPEQVRSVFKGNLDSGGNLSNQGNDAVGFSATVTSATPEPNSFALLALGAGAIGFALRRVQRAKA
jgi:hypothetical protein